MQTKRSEYYNECRNDFSLCMQPKLQNIPQRSHEKSNMHQSVTSVLFHLFKRQKKKSDLKMKGNKHALADERKHKWQDYFTLWKIKRREETFKCSKKLERRAGWRSVTGRSEGKIEGISVRARGGESLARLKGFEAAQISNTALVASRAWNLSFFGVALAANSPSSFSAWQKHFLNFPSLVLLFFTRETILVPLNSPASSSYSFPNYSLYANTQPLQSK